MNAYEIVRTARSGTRPTALDYITSIFPDFIEFHGDRLFSDDKAIVGGIATLQGMTVTVIGIEKGHTSKERLMRSFGSPSPEGYRKAGRLMALSEKFRRPVITFVDTSGAFCGIEAEERGEGEAIASDIVRLSSLTVPVISLMIGEGGSGGALALAVADRLWMLENAIFSVISPEGCASILWRDASKAPEAAEALHLTAKDAISLGIADRIISEEGIGSEAYYTSLGDELHKEIMEIMKEGNIRERRYMKLRNIGAAETYDL